MDQNISDPKQNIQKSINERKIWSVFLTVELKSKTQFVKHKENVLIHALLQLGLQCPSS